MAYVPVPTRSSTTSSMYADVNQLQDNIDVIYAAQHPIGSQYTQVASVASNTIATACPSSESPATLFGGTWTKLWSTEATYFRTEGDPDASEGQDAYRTTGSEPDRMQEITGTMRLTNGDGAAGNIESASGVYTPSDSAIGHGGNALGTRYRQVGFDSANSTSPSTARTGLTTQVKNRIMIIWKRTA